MRDNILDKWIEARLKSLILEVSGAMDSYGLDKAVRSVGDFVDDFSNWYIRRSRERFKEEKNEAVNTTHFMLLEFSKLIAPFMPFVADEIYRDLRGDKESVHLEDWPEVEKISKEEEKILEEMKKVRDDISVGLDLRLKAGIKVRQPLFSFETPNKFSDDLETLIKDELNVKEVKVGKDYKIDTKITEELKEEGQVRELMRQIQEHRKKIGLKQGEEVEILINADSAGQNFIEKHRKVLKNLNIKNFKFVEEKREEVVLFSLTK